MAGASNTVRPDGNLELLVLKREVSGHDWYCEAQAFTNIHNLCRIHINVQKLKCVYISNKNASTCSNLVLRKCKCVSGDVIAPLESGDVIALADVTLCRILHTTQPVAVCRISPHTQLN
jgi:hypothetical protein